MSHLRIGSRPKSLGSYNKKRFATGIFRRDFLEELDHMKKPGESRNDVIDRLIHAQQEKEVVKPSTAEVRAKPVTFNFTLKPRRIKMVQSTRRESSWQGVRLSNSSPTNPSDRVTNLHTGREGDVKFF